MSTDSSSITPRQAETPKKLGSIPLVPWKPWVGLLFASILFFVAQLLSGVFVSIYPAIKHWTSDEATSWLQSSVGAQFFYILLAELLTIGGIYLFLKYYKVGFAKIGLLKPRITDFAWGFGMAPVYFVIYLLSLALVATLVPSFNAQQAQDVGFNNVVGTLPMVLTFISLVILPPITEEIMVRGFLYSSLKKAMPMIWAVLLTSAIFAIAHLPEGGDSGPLYVGALDTFILSLFLIWLREKTGSLWASITLHAFKNGVAFAALFVFHVK